MVKDIFLSKIGFSNNAGAKIRPILLIQKNSYGDFIFIPLTTNLEAKGISIGKKEIERGYLPKKSIAVTEKISVISPSLLTKKLASINPKTYKRVIKDVCLFLKKT